MRFRDWHRHFRESQSQKTTKTMGVIKKNKRKTSSTEQNLPSSFHFELIQREMSLHLATNEWLHRRFIEIHISHRWCACNGHCVETFNRRMGRHENKWRQSQGWRSRGNIPESHLQLLEAKCKKNWNEAQTPKKKKNLSARSQKIRDKELHCFLVGLVVLAQSTTFDRVYSRYFLHLITFWNMNFVESILSYSLVHF